MLLTAQDSSISGIHQPDEQEPSFQVEPLVDTQNSKQCQIDTQDAEKPRKPRHRASVACNSCRNRRIRCVVPSGEKRCKQCKHYNLECIMVEDERRKPVSRAHISFLTERVALLEGMLKELGTEPPSASDSPRSRCPQGNESLPTQMSAETQSCQFGSFSHGGQPNLNDDHEAAESGFNPGNHWHMTQDPKAPQILLPSRLDDMASKLFSTRGFLSFDQPSGQLRYFGPTTNCHVHSGYKRSLNLTSEFIQARQAERIMNDLTTDTYNYLMELFWQCYNPVIHVLHQDAFEKDRKAGRMQFYSGFLHICVLAVGFRFADKTRVDVQKISLPSLESTLHLEAKHMLDDVLKRPGGIPSIIALLLLGGLECAVGRDTMGWLYGGLAMRLAFDMGLHLDAQPSGLPAREIEIRRMTFWACVIHDQYWALFLGRPTSIKGSYSEIYSSSRHFRRLGTCRPAGSDKTLETQIYEALLALMEIAGRIADDMDVQPQDQDLLLDRRRYLQMVALDQEFSDWYANLPEQLCWDSNNIKTAPFSFFLLHQQYHSSLILLHRPFAMYTNGKGGSKNNRISALCETVCTTHAIQVAKIFWQHRQRFNNRKMFLTGMQHAGTAATALIGALAFVKNPIDRNENLQHLECLSAALHDMSYIYQPAEHMSIVLRAVLAELDSSLGAHSFQVRNSTFPCEPFWGESTNSADETPSKIGHICPTEKEKNGLGYQETSFNISIEEPPQPQHSDTGYGWNVNHDSTSTEVHQCSENMADVEPSTITAASSTLSTADFCNPWMNAELDHADRMSELAKVHFPEISAFEEAENVSSGDIINHWSIKCDEQNVGVFSSFESFWNKEGPITGDIGCRMNFHEDMSSR